MCSCDVWIGPCGTHIHTEMVMLCFCCPISFRWRELVEILMVMSTGMMEVSLACSVIIVMYCTWINQRLGYANFIES